MKTTNEKKKEKKLSPNQTTLQVVYRISVYLVGDDTDTAERRRKVRIQEARYI